MLRETYLSRVRSTLVREETAGGAETGYAYNGLGELVQVDLSNGTVVGYFYDGLGRRIGKTVDGELVAGYLWSGRRLVGVLNGLGALEEMFVWGTRDGSFCSGSLAGTGPRNDPAERSDPTRASLGAAPGYRPTPIPIRVPGWWAHTGS